MNERCLYWKDFKGYNNWRVVDFITPNVVTEDEEKVYETILHEIEAKMDQKILIGTFGAMRTNDEATQEFYLVKRITEPYTVQKNTVMKRVESQQSAFVGEIIYDAVFWNPVPNIATD